MSKKTSAPEAVITIDGQIAQHTEQIHALEAERLELEQQGYRDQLAVLEAQREEALKKRAEARKQHEQAKAATRKSAERHQKVVKAELAAYQAADKADFAIRQVEHQIDLVQRNLQP